MDCLPELFVLLGAEIAGGDHIDAAAHADQKAGEQCHQCGGGADGTQSVGTGELADHSDVGHIEQHLQKVGNHEGKTEQQDFFPEGTVGQIVFLRHGEDLLKTEEIWVKKEPAQKCAGA